MENSADLSQIVPSQVAPEQNVPIANPQVMDVKSVDTNYWKVIVIVLGLFILVGGSVFAYMFLKKPLVQNVATAPTPTPQAAVTQTDPTTNWKTYTLAGASLKVPPEFSTPKQVVPTSDDHLTFENSNSLVSLSNFFVNSNWQISDPSCSSAQKCYERDLASAKGAMTGSNGKNTYKIMSSTILGNTINGIQFNTPSVTGPATNIGGYSDFNYYIESNGNVVEFSFHVLGNPNIAEQQKPLIDQILSTFKFIDQVQISGTESWKTYSISNGFSFKYPDSFTYSSKDMSGATPFLDQQKKINFYFTTAQIYSDSQYQDYLKLRKDNGWPINQESFADSQGREWQTDMDKINFTGVLKVKAGYLVLGFSGVAVVNDNSTFRSFANQILSTVEFIN